mmetsp:Transcript_36641/g.79006  ORF Transcript_36641/g.79006 Transcript_36641/m.79006 type:complete len:284 (-) Transcript_36641:28-879(-)
MKRLKQKQLQLVANPLRSCSRGELGCICKGVGRVGVGHVGGPVVDGALASDDGLHVEAEHGEHGQAAVLDLLHLQLSEGVGVVSQAQGVEVLATRVQLVQVLTEATGGHEASGAEGLGLAHQDDLHRQDGQDGLGVHQVGVAQVVQAALGEDLGAGLEPDGLAERDAVVLGQDLGGDAAQGAQHSPASVDDLGLAVGGKGLRVSGQARRVPAVVTGELARQVARGLAGQGTQVQRAVRAVPQGVGGGALGGLGHGAASLHHDGGAAGDRGGGNLLLHHHGHGG